MLIFLAYDDAYSAHGPPYDRTRLGPGAGDLRPRQADWGNATFETELPAWEAWDSRTSGRRGWWRETARNVLPGRHLTPVSAAARLRGVAEASVTFAPSARRARRRFQLLAALIAAAEEEGFWTLAGAHIFPENEASLRLVPQIRVSRRRRQESASDRMNGVWRDVLLLERRDD